MLEPDCGHCPEVYEVEALRAENASLLNRISMLEEKNEFYLGAIIRREAENDDAIKTVTKLEGVLDEVLQLVMLPHQAKTKSDLECLCNRAVIKIQKVRADLLGTSREEEKEWATADNVGRSCHSGVDAHAQLQCSIILDKSTLRMCRGHQ